MNVKCKGNWFGHKSEHLFLKIPVQPGIDRREATPQIITTEVNLRNLLFLPARHIVAIPVTTQVNHQQLLLVKAQMLAYLLIQGCFKILPLAETLDWNHLRVQQYLLKYEMCITKEDEIIWSTRTHRRGKAYHQGLGNLIYQDFLKVVGGHSKFYQLITSEDCTINIREILPAALP